MITIMILVTSHKTKILMKKYLFIALASLFAFTSCSKESNETPEVKDKTVNLTFTSKRPQLKSESKTAWNGSSIVWTSGDRIRVGYTLDGTWMAKEGAADFTSNPKVPAKLYASNNVTIDGTNASVGTFTVPSGFTNSPSGKAVFYGVYPSTQTSEDSKYAPSLTITIPSTQTPVVNGGIASFDKTADILVGKTNEISLSGSFPTIALEMNWNRIVAHADLTFKNLAATISSETIQNIKLTAGETEYLTGSTYIDVGTGAVTTNDYTVNTVTLDGTNLSVSGNQIEAWACILPVTLTSLTVDIETDAAHYIKTFSPISKQFKANARNTLGISMSGATRQEKSAVTIANGNYVIAALSSETYYAISSEANASSARRDRSEITTANFNPTNYSTTSPYIAANNLIWTITNVSGGVTINLACDTDSYMQYSSGNNTLPLGSASTIFAVSSEVDGTFRFSPATDRVIAMNGSNGFACYKTTLSDGVFDLYLIPAAGTPTLTFAETSKSVSASTTAVSFDYTSAFLSADPTVTVTEDNGNAVVSTSVANSKVTATLNENATPSNKTIKLKVAATGVDDVTLTITQLGLVAPAVAGDVLWSEDFSDVNVASSSSTVGNNSCNISNVYGSATVSYTYSDNGTNKTLVYDNNNAGGTAPELLIGKKANAAATVWGIFKASGIPTSGFETLTLSFISNGVLTPSSTTSGVSFGEITSDGNNRTVVITNANAADNIDISFENQTTSNIRIDNIVLSAGAPAAPAPVINVTSDNPMSVANTASTGTIQYSLNNPSSATLTASTTASWISNINYGTGTVTFNVAAQESGAAARSGIITLSYTGASDVEVTVNQAAGPSIGATEYTTIWTATSGGLGTSVGSGNINTTISGSSNTQKWNYTRTLISGTSYSGWTSNCIQLGKNGGVENVTIETENIPGTIKSVSVECSSYQAAHKCSITVGGTTYLSSTSTASWTTVNALTGTGSSSGQIVISFTDGTRALYIKSITVVYEN